MAETEDDRDEQAGPLPLRGALFGGVRRGDVAALQERLADTEARLRGARLALDESAGWARRLPLALDALTRLAAGEREDAVDTPAFERLAGVVREVIGEHLLASVEAFYVSSETSVEFAVHTDWEGPARPRVTEVRVGKRVLRCGWAPGVLAGEDTVAVVAGLCRAVLLTMVGVEGAGRREGRSSVTQLGDAQSLVRHLALRRRFGYATSELTVVADTSEAGEYLELFGRISWQATFAEAAATLQEVAYGCGGEAYQCNEWEFCVVVDPDRAEEARAQLEARLRGGEVRFDVRLRE
ncbi:MAG TPA: hypothetical protein VK790_10185 [Solirubrobacteraceae bacterium]|nr:hypothetical protein [Solirubrobacteraceae bacterium]